MTLTRRCCYVCCICVSEPIPLSEDSIRTSEVYKRILTAEAAAADLMDEDYEDDPYGIGPDMSYQGGGDGKRGKFGGEDIIDPVAVAARDGANKRKVTNFLQRVRNSHIANSRGSRYVSQSVRY